MRKIFTSDEIESISGMLGINHEEFSRGWSWKMFNPKNKQSLVFTIYNDAQVSSETTGSLISVQTQHGYFELHDCSDFLLFEPDEVIFVQTTDEKVSCLIIGRECNCSMFSNISRDILNADFSEIDSPVLLAAMQLSLTESII